MSSSSQILPANPGTTVTGIDFNLANILKYFSMIAPFLIAFFMVMISIFNSNFKGFIYLFEYNYFVLYNYYFSKYN